MGKIVLRCPACNSYYDGGVYSHCPYCKNETGNAVVTVKETPADFSGVKNDGKDKESKPSKKSGFWDRFTRKSSNEEQQNNLPSQDTSTETDIPESSEKVEVHTENDNHEISDSQKNYNDESTLYAKTEPLISVVKSKEGVDSLQNMNNDIRQTIDQTEMRTVGRFIPVTDGGILTQSENVQDSQTNSDDKHSISLMNDIRNYGVTQGRYFSNSSNSPVAPVVGWLVCIKGQEIGKCFNLKKGRNRIGRSVDMDVKLLNEGSVSRTCQAVLIYDSKAREYYLLPGESDSLCYLNDNALYERTALADRDFIEFGDSGKNRYMFVAFCNQDFDWNMTEE